MQEVEDSVPNGATATTLRITKKLPPSSKGAIKLARQFGPALICVRHRVDPAAKFRFTTVELLVEKTPIQPRSEKLVHVRVNPNEYALRTAVRSAGAIWDHKAKLWLMPRRVATVLRVSHRIVSAK